MKKIILIVLVTLSIALRLNAQTAPVITSWIRNTTGAMGYGGILSNVQQVQYDTNYVYVSATCIPGYSIGPWQGNPNIPSNQNFVYEMPRNPQQNTGATDSVGLGHIGVWTNGVSIFNSSDGMTYNNDGVWQRNAYVFEGASFDDCLGHPQQTGEYHHHVSPKCLYNVTDSTHHSPIIGYGFDGYPVYGAYGYVNTNGSGGIKRMRSSFQLRNITTRTTLPSGANAGAVGPPVNSSYPIGDFLEDFIYVAGSGDLDVHNGRFCVTPEYPAGIYAYFVTIDSTLTPVYPFTLGLTYYGVIDHNDVGPMGGHVTISDSVTTYDPTTAVATVPAKVATLIYPNPANDYIYVYIEPIAQNNFTVTLTDAAGKIVLTKKNVQPTISYALNVSGMAQGNYLLTIKNSAVTSTEKIVIAR